MGALGVRSGVQVGNVSPSVQAFWETGWDAVSLDWDLAKGTWSLSTTYTPTCVTNDLLCWGGTTTACGPPEGIWAIGFCLLGWALILRL